MPCFVAPAQVAAIKPLAEAPERACIVALANGAEVACARTAAWAAERLDGSARRA